MYPVDLVDLVSRKSEYFGSSTSDRVLRIEYFGLSTSDRLLRIGIGGFGVIGGFGGFGDSVCFMA